MCASIFGQNDFFYKGDTPKKFEFWGKMLFPHFLSKNIHFVIKIKKTKIVFRHILSWPKLDLEPKFHDPGTILAFFCPR